MMELISMVLPGLGEMANIHPMLVHFPIALLNGFLLMELLGFLLKKEEMRIAATWMLYLGTLGAAATVVAGFFAAASVPHNEEIHAIMIEHRNYGVTVLCLSVFLSLWRFLESSGRSLLQLLVGIVMVTTMALGADLGGLMVYKHGVAVKAVPQPVAHDHSMGGHEEDDMDMEGITMEGMALEEQGSTEGDGDHDDADDHSMPHKH